MIQTGLQPINIYDVNHHLQSWLVRTLAVLVFFVLFVFHKAADGQTQNSPYGEAAPNAVEACVGYTCYISTFMATGLGLFIGLAALALFVYGIFHVLVLSKRKGQGV